MLYYDRIDLSEGHDVVQTTTVTAVKNAQFVTLGVLIMGSNFKFSFVMVCSDISVITAEGVGYHCIIHDIRKPEVIHLLENSVLDYHKMICIKEIDIKNRVYHYYFDN